MKNKFKIIIATLTVFNIAYIPVLFGINWANITALLAYGYIVIKFVRGDKISLHKKIIKIIYTLICLIFYLMVIVFFQYKTYSHIISLIQLLVITIPTSIFIILFLKNEKICLVKSVFKVIVYASLLQSILALTTYFSPEIQNIFIMDLVNYGYNDVYFKISDFRLYGLSTTLTYAMPALQSIIIILILLNQNKFTIKKMISIILIGFSAVINARTSVVIFLIGLLFILLFYSRNIILKFFSWILTMVLSINFIVNEIQIKTITDNRTFTWIISGINEIFAFISGNTNTPYFSYVTNERKYAVPDGIKFITGTGERVLLGTNNTGVRSDVGFINDIWLGGLIYILILYSLFAYILLTMRQMLLKMRYKHSNLLIIFLSTSLIVLNFKGYIFSYNSVVNIIILLYFSLIYTIQEMSISKTAL